MMAPYAKTEVALTTLIGGGVTVAIAYYLGWWAILPAVLTLALLSFYRDPPRRIPAGAELILSPADGKVVEISRTVTHPDFDRPVLRILIFLSVANVHINRSPCAGRIREVRYQPGQFLNALNPEADLKNENNAVWIEPAGPLPGPIRVRQIAGLLARRIVCVAQAGDTLAAGERFGMIKLGSRTEIILPEDPGWEIRVRMGQAVHGGSTILASLSSAVSR